jgi:hypothetical protein
VTKNRCKSSAAQRSFVAHTTVTLLGDVACDVTAHLAGVHMGDIDRLSRGYALQHLEAARSVDTTANLALQALFLYLDPSQAPAQTEPHLQVLEEIHRLVRAALQLQAAP